MDPLSQHSELIEKVAQIVHSAADEGYTAAKLVVCFDPEGEATTNFSFILEDENVSRGLGGDNAWQLYKISEKLHAAMKEHTGGDWTSYTLTLDEVGRAKVKFFYDQ